MFLVAVLYHVFPMTTDVTAPYFGTALVGVFAIAGMAGYGALTSLGGRR